MAASFAAIVAAVNTEVIAELAAASMPPLKEGAILVGPQYLKQHGAPSRVVFVPKGSKLGPKNAVQPTGNASVDRSIYTGRSMFSAWLGFEVHCWAKATTRNDAAAQSGDYDAAQTLVEIVLRAIWKTIGPISVQGEKAIVRATNIEWNDDGADFTKYGREAVFQFEVSTPVLDIVTPLSDPTTTLDGGVLYSDQNPAVDPAVPVTS